MTSNLSRKTLGNLSVLTIGAATETVLQFVFIVIAGRQLGPDEFGFYGYILSLVTLAVTIAHWGLPVVAVREFAQRPSDEVSIFAATFRIRAAVSLLFILAALAVPFFFPLSGLHRTAVWMMFAYLLFLPFDLSPFFDARKLSRWDVPGKVAGRVVSVGLLVILWRIKGEITVVDVALCSSLLMLVNVVVGWRLGRRIGLSLRPFAPTREIGSLFRFSALITWSNVTMMFRTQGQTILVKWFSTALETGFYALANRLMMPLLVFKGLIYRVLLPIVSEVGYDRSALTARLERILPILALIFMPVAALGIPAVEVLVVPIFGADYAGAVLPLQISISIMLLSGMASLFGTVVLAAGDARTSTIGLTIGCGITVALCALAIPKYGAVGAAWAGWLGEFFSVLYPLPKFLRVTRPAVMMRFLRTAVSSLTGTAAYYFLTRAAGVPDWLSLIAAFTVVSLALWLSGELSIAQLSTLLGLVRKSASSEMPNTPQS